MSRGWTEAKSITVKLQMNIPRTLIVRRESGPTANLATTPLLQRIYAARGVSASSELSHRLHHMNPPAALKNSEAAAELLETALRQRWRIVIVADLDADGVPETSLLTYIQMPSKGINISREQALGGGLADALGRPHAARAGAVEDLP
jgi:hypothetical protein